MALLSLTEAAKKLNMSRQSVYYAINAGLLPAQRIGNQWVLREEDVAAYQPRSDAGRRRQRPEEE